MLILSHMWILTFNVGVYVSRGCKCGYRLKNEIKGQRENKRYITEGRWEVEYTTDLNARGYRRKR